MAYTKLYETKKGERYWKIEVYRGQGLPKYTTRFYWRDGISKKTAERELAKAVADFERACESGDVLSRAEKKEMDRKAAEEQKERERLAAIEAAKIKTVRQYADSVFMPKKEITFSENGRSSYRMFLDKHILPVIGDYPMHEISSAMLTKMMMDFQKKGYAIASCVKLFNITSAIFDMAFRDDTIAVNPMMKVDKPTARKDEVKVNDMEKAYTSEEIVYIESCLTNEPLKWQAYLMVSIETGMRKGEVCGLQWADINFKDGSMKLSRNLQYTPQKGVYETTLKTGTGRTVYISPETASLLQRLRDAQSEKCLSRWVFSIDGSPDPMHPQTPTRYFKKFEKKYGVKDFHPHKLRHSFASRAILNGADVLSVSKALGHAKPDTTLRMYSHTNEEAVKKASEIARNAIKAVVSE